MSAPPAPVLLRAALPVITPPRTPVPEDAWDCHAHVFGPADRFPLAPGARYRTPRQDAAAYVATLDALGVRHGVLVQPSVYGTDNRCLLAGLAAQPGRLVGVVDLDVVAAPPEQLERLSAAGVRGLRVALARGHATDGRLLDVADRLVDVGWHLAVRVADAALWPGLAPVVLAAADRGVDVMVESVGSPAPGHVDSAGFAEFLRLLSHPRLWTKLSHPYQLDPGGPPYAAADRPVRAALALAPDRCVWGSDWPHPLPPHEQLPDDADLVDLVGRWTDGPEQARAVLVDNPARFYRTR